MPYVRARRSLVFFFSSAICFVCYPNYAFCGTVKDSAERSIITGANLRLKLGMYRESANMPPLKVFGLSGGQGLNQKIPAAKLGYNYSAQAGASYVVSVKNLGNVAISLGYHYKMNKMSSANTKNIGEKIKNESLPFGELFWEKQGILFLENMTLSVGALGLIGADKNDEEFSVNLTCALRYRLGSLFVIYAGVRLPAHFQSLNVGNQLYQSLRPILGIELST